MYGIFGDWNYFSFIIQVQGILKQLDAYGQQNYWSIRKTYPRKLKDTFLLLATMYL
jgi:hypothetical protein